jgi:shikimate dehydrogenase
MSRATQVVVTLPARTPEEARREIEQARDEGADVAEIRWDRWPEARRADVGTLFPSPLPLLGTYRSRAEGGEAASGPLERAIALAVLAQQPFQYLDVEAARDLPIRDPLARALHRQGAPTLVVSSHLPEGTPAEEIRRRLWSTASPPAITKVVVPAGVREALERLLPVLPAPDSGRYVVHTTGRSGPLLRAWAERRGMALVFARLHAVPTSPGPIEAAQIPVAWLVPFLRAEGSAPLFGLLGRSVSASPSPELHQRWMRSQGHAGLYLPLDILDPEELAHALPILLEGGFRGFNVTHPFKVAALPFADRVGRGAEACGCTNTLTFHEGVLTAENTDLAAVLRRIPELEREKGRRFERITVLGSGGAARAALAAAVDLGRPREILARRADEAEALAARFGAELRRPGASPAADLLIHATPAGRSSSPDLDLSLDGVIGPSTFVLDFVYRPHHRFLAQRAAQRGAGYEDGWRLLVYQAAESYGLWWGAPPGPEAIRVAAEAG